MQEGTLFEKISTRVLHITTAIIVIIMVVLVSSYDSKKEIEITVGGKDLLVKVSDNEALRQKGLSGALSLRENHGMLFVFDEPDLYSFWMKDMLFPIDIIWFDENRTLVDIWENALPKSYPELRPPRKKAKYVLEVRAGFSREVGLKEGDTLEFK